MSNPPSDLVEAVMKLAYHMMDASCILGVCIIIAALILRRPTR